MILFSTRSFFLAALSAMALTAFATDDIGFNSGFGYNFATASSDPGHPLFGITSSPSQSEWVFNDFSLTQTSYLQYIGLYLVGDYSQHLQISYEIRQGMSDGNGGTLVASGLALTYSGATFDSIAEGAIFGARGYLPNLKLDAGDYFLGVSISYLSGSGETYLQTTSGAGRTGSPMNSTGFYYNPAQGANYTSLSSYGYPIDFATILTGTTAAVPGPAAVLPFALGGIAALRRRRKG